MTDAATRPVSDLVDEEPIRQRWPRQMVDYSSRKRMPDDATATVPVKRLFSVRLHKVKK